MSEAPSAILIVRLSALGDVVHVLPALAALRETYPEAKIGWAVEEKAAALLRDHPQLDRLHVIPRQELTKNLKTARLGAFRRTAMGSVSELRAEGYEVALDFQSNFRSGALTRLSGAARRIGQPAPFSKEGSRLFYTDTPAPVEKSAHKITRNLELLAPLGIRPAAPPRPSFPASEPLELPPPGPLGRVVIHPGVSVFGALKAWRPSRFGELGEALAAAGASVLFAWGGASEEAQVGRLVAAHPTTAAAPKTSLLGLTKLLEAADLFIGVDSGPLHVAAALGRPVLGLYGPKHPGTYGPFWPQTDYLQGKLECVPCRHRRCPRADAEFVETPEAKLKISPCMDTLSVEAVAARCVELLEARVARQG